MSTANPEIYGQPENYIVTPRLKHRDNAILLSQTGAFAFPKSPNFGGTENDYRGELRRGITQNKIHMNESLDLSICSIGQDKAVSAYGSWQIWRIDRDGDNPKPVRDKYFAVENNVNTFFYTGWYNDGAVERFHTLWTRTNYNNGRFMCWIPNAERILDSSNVNPNVLQYPIVTYGTKTIIGVVWVGLFNTQRPDLGLNWVKLEQWRDNYNTQKIAAIALELATPKEITGSGANQKIIYTPHTETVEYGEFQRVSAALLNTIDGRVDYSMLMPSNALETIGESSVYLLSLYNYDNNRVNCPEDTRVYVPCEGLFENDTVWWSWSKKNGGGDMIYIARVIPYTANNYEAIMKMAACFGVPFVTKTKDIEFNMLTGWNDNDLYFPVIDDNGICHGEYTHGADNLTNPFNNLDNVREKNYNPTADIDPNTYSDTTNWNNVDFRQAFTKRYLLTGAQVAQLSTELWAAQSSKPADIDYNNFAIDEYLTNNPIDTIVSLKYFPCTFADTAPAVVHLGKYTTNIAATALGTSVRVIDFAPIECFPHFGDFRDYEPHTELAMYIPFCGTVKIPTAEVMGNYVSVKLAIDTSTGAATGYVIVSKTGSGGICVATCQGMAAIDIPVSGLQSANLANAVFNATANWTQTQVNNISANSGIFKHMGGAIGTIARGMTNSIDLSDVKGGILGGPIGAAGNLINRLNPISALQKGMTIDLDNAKADYELSHIQVPTRLVGSASPALGCVIELDCRLIIYRPVTDENALSNYADTVGYATLQGGTVSQFSGFTVGTIDVSGINATAKEKQAIAAAFANGVYL